VQVFGAAAYLQIESATAVFRRVPVMAQMLMLLVTLDLALTPCVPAAIEETTALGARVQEVLARGTAGAVAVAEAVAGADDKKDSRSRKQ
jgi:hypothetical protein